jgi:Mn-dependent DtxR family transcriptional regulator
MTLDEKYLIQAYNLALKKGDYEHPLNFMSVAKSINMKESAATNTTKLLAQANFIVKIDDLMIRVTSRGEKLVLALSEK